MTLFVNALQQPLLLMLCTARARRQVLLAYVGHEWAAWLLRSKQLNPLSVWHLKHWARMHMCV
jgi:hypothetical protein